ncbi:SWIM zinc finger domain-containing protein [Cohnella sp. REN36]|uniref:SWIM zinc finger family protein n=1 Tax=Cohnella sp. REN36 TaxID=2887347 RepID=UPI001D14BEC3|nr:hypothetical protein [Cohnella sp. REN36]MCC3374513.1 hypothetical protein [Cohnella sp. REN36]
MKLNEFEKHVPPGVLKRGKEYRDEGRIVDIDEVEKGIYQAEVEGSELYEIQVRIGSRGDIQYLECDCPFDQEAFCKHQVAVLLEIRSMLDVLKAEAPSAIKGKTAQPKKKLADQLAALSKEQLVALLTEYAQDIREVKAKLDLYFLKSNDTEDVKQLVKLIRTYVKRYAERGGFVSYRNVPHAVEGAELVLDKARQAQQDGEFLPAVRIGLCVVQELADLSQTSDDSGGIIGGLIGEGLDLIAESIESADALSSHDKKGLLRTLLQAAQLSVVTDWRVELLEIATDLVGDVDARQQWEACVQRLEAHDGSREDSYFKEKVAMLRYGLTRQIDGEQRAETFLQANIGVPDIREAAIENAIAQSRYEEALRYAQEGEVQDTQKGYPGLVSRWKKLRLKVYRLTNDREQQRELTEAFVSEGDYAYYHPLKELYTPEEWPDVYARVLTALEEEGRWYAESTYTKVLIEEKETGRLLEYVERHPAYIVDYYKHLIGPYTGEVYHLFARHIERSAQNASNRKQYWKVCQIIRELQKAGGTQTAQVIVKELRLRYANRPAMLDELNKSGL